MEEVKKLIIKYHNVDARLKAVPKIYEAFKDSIDVGWHIGAFETFWGNTRNDDTLSLLIEDLKRDGHIFEIEDRRIESP